MNTAKENVDVAKENSLPFNPNLIDSLNHPQAQEIRELLTRDGRKLKRKIIIDDEENIIQALRFNIKFIKIIATDKEQLTPEFRQQLPADVPIIELARRTGKKLFGGEKMSRIFAIANMPRPLSLPDLAMINNDIIVLDKLTISGNVGAILRTSAALSIGAMVLLDSDPVDSYDRRVIRASRGFVFKVPVLSVSTKEFIQFCKTQQIKMLVTTSHTDKLIEDVIQDKARLALIFGSEKQGCEQALMAAADIKAKIQIVQDVESLNVSVAASIILYLRNLYRRNYRLELPGK